LRGLIRWDLVRRDLRRATVVVGLVAVGWFFLVHAMNRVDAAVSNLAADRDEAGGPVSVAPDPAASLDLPHPKRSLDTVVRFVKGQDGNYRADATATLTVAPGDPVIAPIRTGDLIGRLPRLFPDAYLSGGAPRSFFPSPDTHLEQTGTRILIVQTTSSPVEPWNWGLTVLPASDVEDQHISITTADRPVEAVRGATPTAQDAYSVQAVLKPYDHDLDEAPSDDQLTVTIPARVAWVPPAEAPAPFAPNGMFEALVSAVPLILLAMISTTTIEALRRIRVVLLPTLGAVSWVQSGAPTASLAVSVRYHDVENSLLLIILPVALYLGLRAAHGADVLAGRFAALPWTAAVIAIALTVAVLPWSYFSGTSVLVLFGSVVLCASVTAAIGRLVHPRTTYLGAGLGALFAVGAIVVAVMDNHRNFDSYNGYTLVISAATTLLWIPAALAFAWSVTKRRSWLAFAAAASIPCLVFLPIALKPYPQLFPGAPPDASGYMPLIFIAAFVLLWRIGDDASVYADPWSRRLAVAVVMLAFGTFAGTFLIHRELAYEPIVLAGVATVLLLPRSRVPRAMELGAIDRAEHSENMAYEIRRRLLRASESDYLRTAREKLASGDLSARTFRNGFSRFRSPGPPAQTAVERALGSPAGATPWRNGVTAGLLGLLLAIPTAVLLDPGMANLHVLEASLSFVGLTSQFDTAVLVFRWAVVAFVYGYFYPLLPGRTAVVKAVGITLAILVPRLTDLLIYSPPESGGLVIPTLIATAQCLTFGLSLGLLWEMRLARLADVPWTRVRNIRSLKAVAVPLTTVSVAAAVAAATTLTNYAMAPITIAPKPTPAVSSPIPAQGRPASQTTQDQNEVAPPTDGATR
jgi:hypothetical protein